MKKSTIEMCPCGFPQSSPIPHEHDQTDREKAIIKYFQNNHKDINAWAVMIGKIVFSCRTRKQAREFAKKRKVEHSEFKYIGKCVDNYSKIILDV